MVVSKIWLKMAALKPGEEITGYAAAAKGSGLLDTACGQLVDVTISLGNTAQMALEYVPGPLKKSSSTG